MASKVIYPHLDAMAQQTDTDWDTARDATASDAAISDTNLSFAEGYLHGGSTFLIKRTFFTFIIPSGILEITSATFKIYNLLYTSAAVLIKGTRSDPESDLTTGDYDEVDFSVPYSDSFSGLNPTVTLNQAGINHLNAKIGSYAELVVVNQKDYSDTEPDGNSFRTMWYSADASVSTIYWPRLTINYIPKPNNISVYSGTTHISSNALIHISSYNN